MNLLRFASAIAAPLLGLWLAASTASADTRLLAQDYQPACPPGGYGVASCPTYGTKSEVEAGRAEAASSLPPSYQTTNDCLKAGWGISQCQGFDAWWRSNQNVQSPEAPPPAYKATNDCLKAGWGITQCQGFDAYWRGNKGVEAEPNPNQHQGCGGFGTTECPQGGGAGGKH